MKNSISKTIFYCAIFIAILFNSSCHRDEVEPTAVTISCNDITTDAVWEDRGDGIDYVLNCVITVNAKLTIMPGVTIQCKNGAGIIIETTGSLVAAGTAALPIEMKGEQDVTGVWKGIYIKSNNVLNEINYCTISNAGSSSFDGASTMMANIRVSLGAKLKLTNSIISKSGKDGLRTDGFDSDDQNPIASFANNNFKDNANLAITTLAPTINSLDGTGSTYTGNGRPYIEMRGGRMFGTHVWKKLNTNVAYLVSGYTVAGYYTDQGNLTVNPGAQIAFAADQGMGVGEYSNGFIRMVGTAADEIHLNGETTSFGPSSWKGIVFQSANTMNKMSYVHVLRGGTSSFTGDTDDLANISIGGYSAGAVDIDNCWVASSSGYGIFVNAGSTPPTLVNVTYSSNTSADYFEE